MVRIFGIIGLFGIFASVQPSFGDEWIVKFTMADMESAAAGEKVEGFVRDLYGMDEVDLDLAARSITVTFESNDIDLNALKENIAAADFSIIKTIPVKEG
jgi:copper chaperone CopZ